ncbi:unnamed protein product [Rotaria sp. Silwood2]|nr:unnamed protein product [Rotaria sp. Silwood2]CAF3099241.1 unnamed protein product [Rotaria sp. Silwood2]CAF3454320.1 unnamed protein product [Rotaria sp. Silwood2]CAF4396742.1 unnamed protein product [Rotaria sp. Silwood2]CAF4457398.1 unnamed protein product [Rotaria sp. Silwood2]
MVITRSQQRKIDEQNQRQCSEEVDPLDNIESKAISKILPTEVSLNPQAIPFEMTDKLLISRISKQLDQWPTFGGKLTENVIKWLKDITNELDVVKFDDSQKLSVIQTSLIDDARKWFISNMEKIKTSSEFNEAIKQSFSSTFAKEATLSKVAQRSQDVGETVMHY